MTPVCRRSVRKNAGTMRKWLREIQYSTYAPGLSTPSYLSRIVAQAQPSSLCCPRSPSHHPFNLTSIFLVPALHLLPPSTPIHSLHMSKPCKYSVIHSTRQLSFYSSSSNFQLYPFVTDTPTKLLSHFVSRTFTLLLSALLTLHASAPYKPLRYN